MRSVRRASGFVQTGLRRMAWTRSTSSLATAVSANSAESAVILILIQWFPPERQREG
jgi:hypothetical protein